MKKYLLTPLAAALTLTLTACGGGSSGDDKPSQGTGSGGVTAPLQKISLQAYTYSCQTETPYATDIVFHNEAGKPVGTAKTNAEGMFSGEIPKDTKHVSVLGDEVAFDDGEYKKIRTVLDIENRTDLGKFYFNQLKSDCGCETYTLDTSELSYAQTGYSLYAGYFSPVTDTVRVCTDEDIYFSVVANDSNEAKATITALPTDTKTIKLTDADFTDQGVWVDHQVSAGTEYITTAGYFEETNAFKFYQFRQVEQLTPVFIFPTLTEHNFYRQYFDEDSYVGDVNVRMQSQARSRIKNDGTFELTELPVISPDLSADIVAFANASDLSYDFSSVDDRLTNTEIDFSFLVDDAAETRFDMNIRGYISGQVPDLSFGSVFPEPTGNATLEQLDIFLYGYAGNPTDKKSVDALLEERAQGKHITKDKFSNYVYIDLDAALD
ncbi:hypothetical protein C1E24_17320 [Pseudoalteromonas phenolica]|uniref:Lipoprotein n=1 Tax=Pseudoalteromonas phenolica TaxID=161398 RepID=A0A5R9PYC5_9GAMM|nr:hypothetical protein [Pseudoalteromonas phenolica]TLX45675.1 hypothetical protein C1E24_17320 [Pseudoalteromonas phenolica]